MHGQQNVVSKTSKKKHVCCTATR